MIEPARSGGASIRPLTIVQVYPSLGIGGAESYLWRLSAALIRRGHRIILLTQRTGAYGERAGAAGAEIVEAPFTAQGRAEAARRLRPLGADLVHAHNYRAARFARPLAADLGRTYLMSVHGPRHPLKLAPFRDWSDTVVAMSEGDRDNITGLFGIPAARVALGFYGVEMERRAFGAEDRAEVRREWGIGADERLIVNMSRFTHRKARPALHLIDAAADLVGRGAAIRVALVGTGAQAGRIEQKAERVNRRLDRSVVVVAGARTDVARVLSAADVAVATAQTALEAMSFGVPTIAYGRTGYYGVVARDAFESARAVCFGDHGRLPRGSAGRLAADVGRLLGDREAAVREAEEVRRWIAERYTADHMGADMERTYIRVLRA